MTKVNNPIAKSNSQRLSDSDRAQAEQMIEQSNARRILNQKIAGRIKGKAINLNQELSHLGGVHTLIHALNEGLYLMKNSGSEKTESEQTEIECLSQLRDTLIKEFYGTSCFNLVESLLS